MASKDKKKPAADKDENEFIRRFKQNPLIFTGSFLVLILVIVTFVAPSSLGLRRGAPSGGKGPDLTFGYYDKVPIAYVPGNYFAQYHEMVVRYRQNQMNADNSSYMNFQIWRESFEGAAIHTAMLQEMKRAGYKAPEEIVNRDVAKLPQFQENGKFSVALYKQLDKNRELTLWRQVQDDITKGHFLSDMSGLLTSPDEGEFIGNMAESQRSFRMAVIPVDGYPDEEYSIYADEHGDLFRSLHLSMITVSSSEREANKILASVKNEEKTFEDAAREHSRDPYADKGGDMGIKMVYELNMDIPDEAVRETVAGLAKGAFSDVIKTSSGWSFFRAEEAAADADISDSAVMDRIRSYVRNYERGRMEDWAVEKAGALVASINENGFDKALESEGLTDRSFGPIPLNYGNIDLFTTLQSQSVDEIYGSASNENFWKTAFSTPIGEPSQPVVQGGNILVLYPTEEIQADESSVESIASNYNSYWLRYRTDQSMQEYFMNSPKLEDKFYDVYSHYFSY